MTVPALNVVDDVLAVVRTAAVIDEAGDFLNASRFLAEHGDRVRYAPELGRWFVWNGAWWEEDRHELVQEMAKKTVDGLRSWVGEADRDEFKSRSKHYMDSTRSGRRDGLLSVARTNRSVAVAVDQLDRLAHLLACRNGTINLRTGELLPADPGHLITRGVDLDYDPDARSELWEKFLETVFNHNTETISFVQSLMGYATTGETSEHLLTDLYGSGANGKSTFITAITGVLDEHAAVAPEGLLVEQKYAQHPERIAMLRGRRLVVSEELEKRDVLAEGLVKSITGGTKLTGRHMHGNRFEFQPTHTVVLATNHLPRVRGTDEAIWRRLRVVPFAVTIPPDDRIPDLGKQLAENHGQAILAWLVNGAVDYYKHGLREAEQVRQATFNYRQGEDTFRHFLDECTVEIRGRTSIKGLLAVWRDWARANGCTSGRNQDFVDSLEAYGIVIDRGHTSFARGIGIVAETTSDQETCTTQHHSPSIISHTRVFEKNTGREVLRGADPDETAGQGSFDDLSSHCDISDISDKRVSSEVDPPELDDADIDRFFAAEYDDELAP